MKIAIVGYGVEGKALTQYFRKHRHDVTVCDISEGPKKELEKNKIHIRLGPHYLQNLGGFDLIFRSPGIPYLKKEFDPVRKKLTSATKYFFEKCPCPIVGITGTKGKGTVSTLLFEILKAFKKRVFLGGNIGKSPMEFLDELIPRDLVILELSSFQLQDLQKSPHIAVVLGITPDHLDHHKNIDEYIDAKRNIVRFQGPKDFAVLDIDNKLSASFVANTKAKSLSISLEKSQAEGGFLKVGSFIIKRGKTGMIFGEKNNVKLLGDHNVKNILAAATAAHILGAPIEVITKTVREFSGLPHRLEFVKETGGAKYYNDSASTNPDTTIAALHSFTAPLILIAGGSDKNADFTAMGEEIANRPNVKTVILMGQTKPKIERAIEVAAAKSPMRRSAPLELISADSYQEAFMVARTVSSPGDVVLLSPACASFGMFKNYQERGDIFRNFVLDMEGQ